MFTTPFDYLATTQVFASFSSMTCRSPPPYQAFSDAGRDTLECFHDDDIACVAALMRDYSDSVEGDSEENQYVSWGDNLLQPESPHSSDGYGFSHIPPLFCHDPEPSLEIPTPFYGARLRHPAPLRLPHVSSPIYIPISPPPLCYQPSPMWSSALSPILSFGARMYDRTNRTERADLDIIFSWDKDFTPALRSVNLGDASRITSHAKFLRSASRREYFQEQKCPIFRGMTPDLSEFSPAEVASVTAWQRTLYISSCLKLHRQLICSNMREMRQEPEGLALARAITEVICSFPADAVAYAMKHIDEVPPLRPAFPGLDDHAHFLDRPVLLDEPPMRNLIKTFNEASQAVLEDSARYARNLPPVLPLSIVQDQRFRWIYNDAKHNDISFADKADKNGTYNIV